MRVSEIIGRLNLNVALPELTKWEYEVVHGVLRGLTNQEIADHLGSTGGPSGAIY